MNSKHKNLRTYIQGDISQKQKETVQAHMSRIGFDSASTSDEMGYESRIQWSHITAKENVLEDSSQLPMHSHNFMEIFRYTSDSQVEYLIGTQRYLFQKGDIICVPPGTFHQVLHYEPRNVPCVRELIAVSPAFLEYAGWSDLPKEYYVLRATRERRDAFANLCSMCVEEANDRELYWQNMLSGYLQILLTMIVRSDHLSISAEKDGVFENVLAYIDGNINQKITLADTAKHFYTSERTITREFQKHLGISFHRYLTQRRLMIANNLLHTDLPLEEICRQVGYSDYPTFYRAFKKEYGVSPRQMKNDR